MGKQLFDVVVLGLVETYVELSPWDGTIIMGYRTDQKLCRRGWQGVQPAPTYLEINESFGFSQF